MGTALRDQAMPWSTSAPYSLHRQRSGFTACTSWTLCWRRRVRGSGSAPTRPPPGSMFAELCSSRSLKRKSYLGLPLKHLTRHCWPCVTYLFDDGGWRETTLAASSQPDSQAPRNDTLTLHHRPRPHQCAYRYPHLRVRNIVPQLLRRAQALPAPQAASPRSNVYV
ncbi:hypothetical protein GALMADRAFT_806110 [Galerina marginata CBS 339.88]|uniref:Uncharacterized protein n=1 Tax=Galerina marginata (strain CBS 339.88) TaxID=685588 RepID=A0A067SM48_GALM3|nr:hypothetical protein GALMADRAFT_806110 [Galerina marginata CBS 339.88]